MLVKLHRSTLPLVFSGEGAVAFALIASVWGVCLTCTLHVMNAACREIRSYLSLCLHFIKLKLLLPQPVNMFRGWQIL